MIPTKSFKHIVFTTAMAFTSLLYSMEEKNPYTKADNVDQLAEKVDALSIQSEKPTKAINPSHQEWWFLQENKSPFTVLNIDPYVSKEELHDSLSKIPDNEENKEIVLAKYSLMRSYDSFEHMANEKIEDIRSKLFPIFKPFEERLELMEEGCSFLELYRVTPAYCLAFFRSANAIIGDEKNKAFTLTTVANGKKTEGQKLIIRCLIIVNTQDAFIDKFKMRNISSNDSDYSIKEWEKDFDAVRKYLKKAQSTYWP